ncbi:MAG TPA: hypothetical protein VN682_08565 [Terriglobales bacterium]|nr:hypothetical protein [Terriglobales bacterium]HXF12561.1 hypothetical protein [Terriglobales bacterium]
MSSTGGSLLKLVGAFAAVVAAAALISLAPDFKRYLKIESM